MSPRAHLVPDAMLSENLRVRLARLNRAQQQHNVKPQEELGHQEPVIDQKTCPLKSLSPDGFQVTQSTGNHWLIRQPLHRLWPYGHAQMEQTTFHSDPPPPTANHQEIDAFRRRYPRETVFLDLETCGFAGSMIFLIGLIHPTEEGLVLSQLLARNYAEEKPVLESLWQLVSNHHVLVTFNGKSFDWPQVRDRSTLHHVGAKIRVTGTSTSQLIHFDLLHHARRRWGRELPDCKLQTLERYICGRRRTGDIPGRDIPPTYHQFVRSGDVRGIRCILHHNALDLVTLLQLSLRVAT